MNQLSGVDICLTYILKRRAFRYVLYLLCTSKLFSEQQVSFRMRASRPSCAVRCHVSAISGLRGRQTWDRQDESNDINNADLSAKHRRVIAKTVI
jgi:hypothetical protein